MKALNIGCGKRFHPDWTNIDLVPSDPSVMAHDTRKGLPFPDDEFDFVYHSHMLEHMPRPAGASFIRECRRVLKPGGVLRVVVPDLEGAARAYLETLETAETGDEMAAANHEWMTLELLDQASRHKSCGGMLEYLKSPDFRNEAFVVERCGDEIRLLLEQVRTPRPGTPDREPGFLKRSLRFAVTPSLWKEYAIRRLLGKDYENLEIGRFRQSGEIHFTMYDRFSLGRLLEDCDLEKVESRGATESHADEWKRFELDADADGNPRRPHSLFMEAVKPTDLADS